MVLGREWFYVFFFFQKRTQYKCKGGCLAEKINICLRDECATNK